MADKFVTSLYDENRRVNLTSWKWLILEAALRNESFVDDIYEAGVMPEKWKGILDRLAEMCNAEGTVLFVAGPGVPRWLASEAIHDKILAWTQSRWFIDNPRGKRLVPINEPRFLTELDVLSREEIDASDFYTDLLRPSGLGWCVGTTIRAPTGDMLVFSIEKAHEKGPVPRHVAENLDSLRPHLARAALLSARLGLERARATVATLEMIGLPAVALTGTGRVVSANAGFLTSSPSLRIGANDQVQFANPRANMLLMQALASTVNSTPGMGRSIPVASTLTEPPFVAHILPLRGGGLDVFAGAISVLYITRYEIATSPTPELLQALFDLTPAEARVARLIVEGQTVNAIAFTTHTSVNTIRTQLKAVFLKAGVQRQTELVSMLGVMMR